MSSPDTLPVVETVRLWDPLLRLFHWALAFCVVFAWGLGMFGPDVMTLHFIVGYAVAGLLAFRLVWAVFGPRPARFASFVYGPAAILRYLRDVGARRPSGWRGHNPLGGLYILVLLSALAAQVLTGLLADPEDYINVGPLAGLVPPAVSRMALFWHDAIATALLGLVVLHLAAIGFYRVWKREDLIRPMITGWKTCVMPGPDAGNRGDRHAAP